MRSSLRFWLALSLLLGAGATILWLKGRPENSDARPVAWSLPQSAASNVHALLTTPSVLAANGVKPSTNRPPSLTEKYQLRNIEQPIEALTRVESAILMKNALIDTRENIDLPIPADLRAGANPGAYIVQSTLAPTADFQQQLKDAGAEIIAYVPNNAFLVKAAPNTAEAVKSLANVGSVLPYEPYYKLDLRLMKFAVDNEPLPEDAWLRVTFFPGGSSADVQTLANAIGVTEKSPFGEQLLLQPRPGTLASLAQLPSVQIVEPWNPRVAANDLTRTRLGVAENTTTNANHLGLSGEGVWVNVNDVGVDRTHPALTGKVFYNANNGSVDRDGHGTHVAASIAGRTANRIFDNLAALGTNSLRTNYVTEVDDDGVETTTLTIDGSLTNADFRGIAHDARLFILSTESSPGVNEIITDSYLIQTAAETNYLVLKRTNETLISNNSWNYANTTDYDSQAARFDAATRDALPDNTGSQPVTYVFAAGNQGFGAEDGLGGERGTIASPGTAKNVITVGALESPRFIAESLTNVTETIEVDDDGQPQTNRITNLVQIFRPATDSADQVAAFSSRGNVGVGVEGASGRFKPDLVAPGTFIWSARSTNWNLTNDFNAIVDTNLLPMFNVLSNLNAVSSRYRYDSGTSFSAPGVSGLLALIQEFFARELPTDRRRNLSPAMMKALLLNSARSVNAQYDWDPRGRINHQGWGMVDLRNLITADVDDEGRPGPATLAALPEDRWPLRLIDQSPTNALATGEERTWNITVSSNVLQAPLRFTLVWTDPPGNPQVGVKLVNDLDLTVEVGGRVFHGNDFAGGTTETQARDPWTGLALDDPNRDTINNVEKIVVGDPESIRGTNGQPARQYTVRVSGRRVAVKAVNDYFQATGRTNEIVQDYALVISADNFTVTNAFERFDRVQNLTVTTNVFVQPVYNGLEATNQRVGANSPLGPTTNGYTTQWRFYTFRNERNSNDIITNFGRFVAFITSGPLNIGDPRNVEPDIDLYVSKDPRLTNLHPAAVNAAWKSTTRLGTEQVVFAPEIYIRDRNGNLTFTTNNGVVTTNTVQLYDPQNPDEGGVIVNEANVGDIFYIAVKSEDQKAGEYSLISISSNRPFEEDRNGIRIIPLLPPRDIPDGTPAVPQGRRFFGVPMSGGRILDASTYMAIQHEELGDLVGTLGHASVYSTLNNHSLPAGFTNLLALVYSSNPYAPVNPQGYYNDLSEYPPSAYIPAFPAPGLPVLFRPDGPGFLSSFTGMKANPVWTFDVFDDAPSHVGQIFQAEMHVRPLKPPLLSGQPINGSIRPNSQDFYPLDVPSDASKVTVTLTLPAGPRTNIMLLVRKDLLPAPDNADYIGQFTPSGPNSVTVTFDRNSQPPLIPGEYIVGVVNLETDEFDAAVDYTLLVNIERDDSGAYEAIIEDFNVTLTDDGRTPSVVDYLQDRVVTDASVWIVSEHARISDLVLRLTSPQGTSIILSENRGYFDTNGFGSTISTTNFPGPSYAVFTDALGEPIKFTPPPFGDSSPRRGPIQGNGFEGATPGIYTQPSTFDGWFVDNDSVAVISGSADEGSKYVNLDNGSISRRIPTVKGRPYRLSFSYRGLPPFTRVAYSNDTNILTLPAFGPLFNTGQFLSNGVRALQVVGQISTNYWLTNNPDGSSVTNLVVADTNAFPAGWMPNSTNSQWLALNARPDSVPNNAVGPYTVRTTFGWFYPLTNLVVIGRLAADDDVVAIRVNGVDQGVDVTSASVNNWSQRFMLTGPFKEGENQIDFVVTNRAGHFGFRAELTTAIAIPVVQPPGAVTIITNGPSAGFVKVQGPTQTNTASLSGPVGWQRYEMEFVADSVDMQLQFYTAVLPGIDIDNILLEDTGTVFLNPEESLSLLEGERAMGEWKLEAIDNRTGAVNPAIIQHWQVLLSTAAAPRQAEPLAPARMYPTFINNPVIRANTNLYTPGRLRPGETEWFYYDVCDSATVATIALTTTRSNTVPVELLVDRSGFPTGNPETDDYQIIRTRPGTNSTVLLSLRTNSPLSAPLRPGKRIFIGVRPAEFTIATNETFRLFLQPNGCGFIPPTVLSLGEKIENAAFADIEGDEGATYQANTSGATTATITAEGDLTLLASNGVEPTAGNYQLRQTVSNGTATMQLPSGGTWYFRVINESGETVPYSFVVGQVGQGTTIRSVSIVDNHLTVTWESAPGASYEIATSTDLVNWSVATTVQATAAETTYTDPAAASGQTRFIRIRRL